MDQHPITWTPPEPLWADAIATLLGGSAPLQSPAILRFANDDFMQEFMNVLATDPQRLGEYRLLKETWRGTVTLSPPTPPKEQFALALQRLGATRRRRNGTVSTAAGQRPAESSDTEGVPLKLYQPAHQRFYLVTSCLVCQTPGLPDRKVDPGKQEQAGFVLRRLLPPSPNPNTPPGFDATTWQEHAWINTPNGNTWQKAATPNVFVEGEEVLPLFAANYLQDDGRQRRLFAGLIPVGKREAYLAATRAASLASRGTDITARKILLLNKVIRPWTQLVDRAAKMDRAATERTDAGTPSEDITRVARKNARIELQAQSYYILVEFANYLRTYLKTVWDALINETPSDQLPDLVQRAVLDALRSTTINLDSTPNLSTRWNDIVGTTETLLTKLAAVFQAFNNDPQIEVRLDQTTVQFTPSASPPPPADYPPFLFPLADPEFPAQAAQPPAIDFQPGLSGDEQTELNEEQSLLGAAGATERETIKRIDQLAVLIARALATANPNVPQPAIPLAAKQPADALIGWFVIRCVYRRPACGPLHDDVVSLATDPFQLAGFFDPDAPARPIRIGLPIDTSPAGLRKFDKNTAFVISDTLCGQIKRIQGITFGDLVRTVLPFPLHKDLDGDGSACQSSDGTSLGTICSLSIPIITICALIILILMVSLLDIIFHWVPFFLICFPFKGMSAKQS
jgi:hypothetical protein